jgi:hypothetical protein
MCEFVLLNGFATARRFPTWASAPARRRIDERLGDSTLAELHERRYFVDW